MVVCKIVQWNFFVSKYFFSTIPKNWKKAFRNNCSPCTIIVCACNFLIVLIETRFSKLAMIARFNHDSDTVVFHRNHEEITTNRGRFFLFFLFQSIMSSIVTARAAGQEYTVARANVQQHLRARTHVSSSTRVIAGKRCNRIMPCYKWQRYTLSVNWDLPYVQK